MLDPSESVLASLPARLDEAGVPRRKYEIEDVTPPTPGNDDLLTLHRDGRLWVLCYWERGNVRVIRSYADAEEAGGDFYRILSEDAEANRRPRSTRSDKEFAEDDLARQNLEALVRASRSRGKGP